ncbi:nucleotidyltransferase [Glycocaulis albus]|uniref:Cyclic GMP-AMP synthase n=1 Tax=Glycocaulis albus TaxID=1382801 RepID=A0ABQ1XX05_9PROT|nr:nucleotidyltransferase [Glycocaulis albus]GGH05097.1 nucleotidyltransferase [Glycocaulis albus]
MPNENGLTHEEVLQQLHAGIDMPLEIYEEIIEKYESISNWLDRPDSSISQFDPMVAPQGSVRLGTANRPIAENDEYDVDLICRLNASKYDFTQKSLKEAVGREIIAYASRNGMKKQPENKRRCWTLEYTNARNFHVDVLPCIPDVESYRARLKEAGHAQIADNARVAQQAVAITDDTHERYAVISDDWPSSNPLGYAEWFKEQMAECVAAEKRALFEATRLYDHVEDIPDYKVKTTLQKAVQLLKRHRDSVFGDDPEHKPISIIVTTLAARAYNNETTLVEAISNILERFDEALEEINGVVWVVNPVNPEENFADKWEEIPEKAAAFRKWLKAARHDFGRYLNMLPPHEVPESLRARLGTTLVEKVMDSLRDRAPKVAAPAFITSQNTERAQVMVERVRERGTGSAPWLNLLNLRE